MKNSESTISMSTHDQILVIFGCGLQCMIQSLIKIDDRPNQILSNQTQTMIAYYDTTFDDSI